MRKSVILYYICDSESKKTGQYLAITNNRDTAIGLVDSIDGAVGYKTKKVDLSKEWSKPNE